MFNLYLIFAALLTHNFTGRSQPPYTITTAKHMESKC